MIAAQRTGMLAPDQFKEEVALLRLLGQQMTPFIRRSDDPAVISGRTGLVAIHSRRPRELTARYEFGNDETHWITNRHPVEFGSECEFRFTAQDLDLILVGKMTRPIPGIDEQLPNHFGRGHHVNVVERINSRMSGVVLFRPNHVVIHLLFLRMKRQKER